jgi:hypothetical protein
VDGRGYVTVLPKRNEESVGLARERVRCASGCK